MKKLLLLAVIFTAIFASCKKESCPVVVPPIDLSGAIFKGNVTFGAISYDNTTITFKADGVLEYKFPSFSTIYPGTWSKTPNSNTVYIVYSENVNTSVWKGTGTVNADGTKIENGTFTKVVGGSGTGTFTMTKQ